MVHLYFNDFPEMVKVHRAIAECFCEHPTGKDDVNHIDGNKHNNEYTNLEWVSRKENIHHAIDNGLFHRNIKPS